MFCFVFLENLHIESSPQYTDMVNIHFYFLLFFSPFSSLFLSM